MEERSQRIGRWKVLAALLAVFAVCAATGSYWIHERLSDAAHADLQRDLLKRVNVAALLIDVEKHESLVRPSQMHEDNYKELNSRLAGVLAADADLRFIYTMRPTANGLSFVLDPTPLGDADNDGIGDKSNLGDPYSEMTVIGKQVLQTGVAAVEDELSTDRWGTFLSAYAPLKASSGRVVGLIGIDVSAETYLAKMHAITRAVWIGFLLALLSCVAFVVALFGSTGSCWGRVNGSSWLDFRRRSQVLYLGLAALVIGSLSVGIFANLSRTQNLRRVAEMAEESERVDFIEGILAEAVRHVDLSEDSIALISSEIRAVDGALESAVAAQLEELRSKPRDAVGAAIASLDTRRHNLRIETNHLTDESARTQSAEQVCFVISALLSIAALVFVKMAIDQQQRLDESASESKTVRQSHRQIVESLPVGLFRYSAGHCVKGNWALESQLCRQPGESLDDALARSIQPENWRSLQNALEAHSERAESFHTLTQFSQTGGGWRHHEIRGVPIFNKTGDLDHLLCFSVDVHELVVTNERLERQNDHIEEVNASLQRANELLELNFEETVHSLVKVVEAKDPYTAGHSERVMQYSVLIGRALGLSDEQIKTLKLGCLIHDVGKIGIPDEILTKPDRLTEDEFDLIKSHAQVGEDMLKNIPRFEECLSIVRHHHERLDGSGYPDGLTGEDIGLLVRICSVADSYDAMTSTRAYRLGMHSGEALSELWNEVETGRLDRKIVEVFADIINKQSEVALDEPMAA